MQASDHLKPVKSKTLKILLLLILLAAPIIAIVMVFKPLASQKNTQRFTQSYRLPENFTQKDIVEIVKKMQTDPEFTFYFYALDRNHVSLATREAIEILQRSRTKQEIFLEIGELGKKVRSLSILFVNLDYDIDVSGPSEELNKIMWRLLEEEFKLTILGLCYKATFDPDFIFTWNDSARASALKIRKIIERLKFPE